MDSLEESSFGELLQHFRRRRGFTQQQAAAQIGASRNSISYWERGEFLPETLSTVLELARVLDLSEEERRLLIEARFGTASVLPLHHLPTGRNAYFTGRESTLVLLHQQLANGKRAALSQAISGLGGIGKSQTALEYAYRYQQYYHDILWAGSESRESLVTAYISLARILYLHKREEQEQHRIVEAVKHWLATHKRWLLILDNVEVE
jgi:transcriptional regulator with XRE-family HTH domain